MHAKRTTAPEGKRRACARPVLCGAVLVGVTLLASIGCTQSETQNWAQKNSPILEPDLWQSPPTSLTLYTSPLTDAQRDESSDEQSSAEVN